MLEPLPPVLEEPVPEEPELEAEPVELVEGLPELLEEPLVLPPCGFAGVHAFEISTRQASEIRIENKGSNENWPMGGTIVEASLELKPDGSGPDGDHHRAP